ncbi:hypothetical protein ACQR2B_17425 [Bradyrhizobium oligotrophicum]|uniref:hypothetical protein n=1 Tax=Bradyrhizobium TaxID=374 RepID=UPI003EBC628E
MSGDEGQFRTPEQEVIKLLEDCGDIKRALQLIAAQVNRMEARVKKAFPEAAEKVRQRSAAARVRTGSSLSQEQAIAEFENVVRLASAGSITDAERVLSEKSTADLLAIAREVGVSFPKSKPSVRTIREAIFGKVRESLLLSRHTPRTSS